MIERIFIILAAFFLIHGPIKCGIFICGDEFRALAHHLYDERDKSLNPAHVKKGNIIFVKGDYIDDYFTNIHPLIKNPYILITHNCDEPAPGIYENYLSDPKLYHWFGHNPTVTHHPKFTPIPIGIANAYWDHGNPEHFKSALYRTRKNKKKPYLSGINFVVNSNEQLRKPIYDYFIQKNFCQKLYNLNDHVQYLVNMHKARYIISPPGNGLDCHRTWEALIMRSIPIVISSPLDVLFEKLPVLIVDKWEDVTEQVLESNYQQLAARFNTVKRDSPIYFPYWKKVIMKTRDSLLHQ